MASNNQNNNSWRNRVKQWTGNVIALQRNTGSAFRYAANQHVFPGNALLKLLAMFYKSAAKKIVKTAIQSAAQDLGWTLSDDTLNVLSEVAVDTLMG